MNEPQQGPFKTFSVPWFPFSIPACLIGMAAWALVHLTNAGLARCFADVDSAAQAQAIFGQQIASLTGRFCLVEGIPGGRLLFAFQSVVALLVWSTFGLAIARCVALRLTRDEYLGLRDALRFGFRRCRTALLYPLVVGSCVALLAAFNAVVGILVQLPWIGPIFYLVLPLSFLATGLMLVMTLTGFFGVGLVSGAVAVEQRGTLDAWGKTLNYIFARPVHFLIYLVVIKVLLVDVFVHYLLGEPRLLHRWTESALRFVVDRASFHRIVGGGPTEGTFETFCGWLWRGLSSGVDLFLIGAILSFAFSAFTSVFLILRRDVDGIDVSDVEWGEERADPMPIPVEACAHEPPADLGTTPPGSPAEPPPAAD